MPKSSTPALLPAIISPFTPLSTSAAIRFSGMPHSPKPPAAMVMSSFSSPARADFASAKTLLISLAPYKFFARRDRRMNAFHHGRDGHGRGIALVEHLFLGKRD